MNNDDDETIGFKDFLEYTDEINKKKTHTTDQTPGFELFTFLEQESTRLEKRIKLFEEKSFVLKNYPQSKSLINKQIEHNKEVRFEIINKLKQRGSPLFDSMREIFDDHF